MEDMRVMEMPVNAHQMHVFNEQPEDVRREENQVPGQQGGVSAARLALIRMFRRRIWRFQHDVGLNLGPFPENFQVPQLPENIEARLRQQFIRKNRISPTRCLRIGRENGISPMAVCDFFLHLNYPTLHIDLNRPDPAHGRTFLFNVVVDFRLIVANPEPLPEEF